MGRDDWYRQTSWTKDIESEFRQRNQRCRSDRARAQHLRIQAETLFGCGDRDLLPAALGLALECLDRYPKETLFLAPTWDLVGRCYGRLGEDAQAIDAFEHALAAERDFPGVRTGAGLHLVKIVVEKDIFDRFDRVLDVISERGDPTFPAEVYVLNGARALVAMHRKNEKAARAFAQAALEAAAVNDSGLGWGREAVGLVSEGEHVSVLYQRLAALVR